MNVGALACYIIAILFYAIAFIMVLMKENAVKLISGFNTLPKEEQDTYDKKRIVTDTRNNFQVWATLMLSGGVLATFIAKYSVYISIATYAVWLIMFFKEVKLDARKAYAKYKIK